MFEFPQADKIIKMLVKLAILIFLIHNSILL